MCDTNERNIKIDDFYRDTISFSFFFHSFDIYLHIQFQFKAACHHLNHLNLTVFFFILLFFFLLFILSRILTRYSTGADSIHIHTHSIQYMIYYTDYHKLRTFLFSWNQNKNNHSLNLAQIVIEKLLMKNWTHGIVMKHIDHMHRQFHSPMAINSKIKNCFEKPKKFLSRTHVPMTDDHFIIALVIIILFSLQIIIIHHIPFDRLFIYWIAY